MELNKDNLLKMLKEYTKERPISFNYVMMAWADFIEWLDTRGLTLHEAESGTGTNSVSEQSTSDDVP